MKSWLKNVDHSWTLFLDRDGVINKRIFGGYITDFQDFDFLPGVLTAIRDFSMIFNNIFIVTNQQGVGKGIMTLDELNQIHHSMIDEIQRNGGNITQVYSAIELADSDLVQRKPNPYMGLKAKQDFPDIDFNRSIMVGDTDTDLLFGKNCGMKVVLQLSEEKCTVDADIVVKDLIELRDLFSQKL